MSQLLLPTIDAAAWRRESELRRVEVEVELRRAELLRMVVTIANWTEAWGYAATGEVARALFDLDDELAGEEPPRTMAETSARLRDLERAGLLERMPGREPGGPVGNPCNITWWGPTAEGRRWLAARDGGDP